MSLHYFVKCHCHKSNNENKMTSVTHIKKLTTGNVFIVSVIVY